jgi:hypothetical protein
VDPFVVLAAMGFVGTAVAVILLLLSRSRRPAHTSLITRSIDRESGEK